MKSKVLNLIKDETKKRCHIFDLDVKSEKKFSPISTELFHFLYETESLGCPIYFRIDNTMVEFMKAEEFSGELLDQLKNALEHSRYRIEICVLKRDREKFDTLITKIREDKINRLMEMDPDLDRKTLEVFSNLSGASQLIVRGGISNQVANQVKASASFLVNNLMDSQMAIATLSRMVIHDPTLYDHSASVAMMAAMIAGQCLEKPLPTKQAEIVSQCGLYHDVGKTCIPSAILNKPGRFTPDEFDIMKKHAELGEEELMEVIEAGAPIDPVSARVAGEHHERFCGQGYPRGRKGRYETNEASGIHLFTRIVTIADVYSALLMKRVYKPSYQPQDAIKIMAEVAEKEYDPEIFNRFLKSVIESLNQYQESSAGNNKGRILFLDDDGKLRERGRKVI